jgi:carbonic anhydrase
LGVTALGLRPLSEIPIKFKFYIDKLSEGNERFVSGKAMGHNFNEQREKTIQGQHPNIIVLTCSDSRVVPHYIFDEEIGELFIIRKAGNVIGESGLGSIEFAAEFLDCPLFMILGHQTCGAVLSVNQRDVQSAYINTIIQSIKPAYDKVMKEAGIGDDIIDMTVRENVRLQMKRSIQMSDVLSSKVLLGRLAIIGAYYSFNSGMVEFLDEAYY